MTVEELKKTDEFRKYGSTIVKCPICGEPTLDRFWVCDNCGWEFDGAMFPDQYSSANGCTVGDYINKYRQKHNLPIILYEKTNPKFGLDTGFTRGSETIKPLISLQIKKCSDTAILPTKAHPTDACYDIYADLNDNSFSCVSPHTSVRIRTGFCTSIPKGYFAAVFARSGLGCKGLRLANSVGIIDSDYRGEWLVVLRNDSDETKTVHHGDRIAQFTLLPVLSTELIEVDDLDETDRGSGGFGSSGI